MAEFWSETGHGDEGDAREWAGCFWKRAGRAAKLTRSAAGGRCILSLAAGIAYPGLASLWF